LVLDNPDVIGWAKLCLGDQKVVSSNQETLFTYARERPCIITLLPTFVKKDLWGILVRFFGIFCNFKVNYERNKRCINIQYGLKK